MGFSFSKYAVSWAASGWLLTGICGAGVTVAPATMDMSGTASFEAPTTVPGIEVKGSSNAVAGHVTLSRDDRGVALEHVEVAIPVKTLATGMKVRDEHMRKYIFTDSNSQLPDIRFAADSVLCPASAAAQDFSCEIEGTLSIRGTPHSFAIKLNVKQQSGARLAFHASGEGIVKLSDFGIARPSQFGVSTANEIKLKLEFSAKQGTSAAASGGDR